MSCQQPGGLTLAMTRDVSCPGVRPTVDRLGYGPSPSPNFALKNHQKTRKGKSTCTEARDSQEHQACGGNERQGRGHFLDATGQGRTHTDGARVRSIGRLKPSLSNLFQLAKSTGLYPMVSLTHPLAGEPTRTGRPEDTTVQPLSAGE